MTVETVGTASVYLANKEYEEEYIITTVCYAGKVNHTQMGSHPL